MGRKGLGRQKCPKCNKHFEAKRLSQHLLTHIIISCPGPLFSLFFDILTPQWRHAARTLSDRTQHLRIYHPDECKSLTGLRLYAFERHREPRLFPSKDPHPIQICEECPEFITRHPGIANRFTPTAPQWENAIIDSEPDRSNRLKFIFYEHVNSDRRMIRRRARITCKWLTTPVGTPIRWIL